MKIEDAGKEFYEAMGPNYSPVDPREAIKDFMEWLFREAFGDPGDEIHAGVVDTSHIAVRETSTDDVTRNNSRA